MSASQYQRRLENKRRQRADAETKAGSFRSKESAKRADAGKARQAAAKTKSESTARSKMREADRRESDAVTAGKEASKWEAKAACHRKDELALQDKLAKAQRTEAAAAERKQRQETERAARREAIERSAVEERLSRAESSVGYVLGRLAEPKPEKLRILMLGASSDGDLRIGREMKRIQDAVRSALHRDAIEFEMKPAATIDDLLDGISQFRPHVIHFSGHSNEGVIVFEADQDEGGQDAIVNAAAFAAQLCSTACKTQPPSPKSQEGCAGRASIRHSSTSCDGDRGSSSQPGRRLGNAKIVVRESCIIGLPMRRPFCTSEESLCHVTPVPPSYVPLPCGSWRWHGSRMSLPACVASR